MPCEQCEYVRRWEGGCPKRLIDPAELLDLISEAKKRPVASMMASIHISSWHSNILAAVESYLSGDTTEMEKWMEK